MADVVDRRSDLLSTIYAERNQFKTTAFVQRAQTTVMLSEIAEAGAMHGRKLRLKRVTALA
jgi:hypothetical protein